MRRIDPTTRSARGGGMSLKVGGGAPGIDTSTLAGGLRRSRNGPSIDVRQISLCDHLEVFSVQCIHCHFDVIYHQGHRGSTVGAK